MSSARDAAETAYDAVFEAIIEATRLGRERTPAVLAALGIPADADADDVRAAMLMWNDPSIECRRGPAGWRARQVVDGLLGLFASTAFGNTRAAAVLALADKLAAQEATDA